MRRVIQCVLLAAGAVLLVAMVRAVGVARIAGDLQRLGWGFLAVVAIELTLDGCNTAGWRRTLEPSHRIGFWRLFWVRQAGTAVNQLTPTATLGGELVKTMLLKAHIATVDAVASLIAARMTFALAQAALCVTGLVIAVQRLGDSPELAIALVTAAALLILGIASFILLQRRGMFAALTRGTRWAGVQPQWLTRLHGSARGLDQRLGRFYGRRTTALAASVAWHLAAQSLSVLQLLFILHALGVPTSIFTALAIEGCALVIDGALFFVPARLGVQEGGRVLVFTALGPGAAIGLSVAVVVRLTQLVVSTIGLAAFGYLSLTNARVAVPLDDAGDPRALRPVATNVHPTRTA